LAIPQSGSLHLLNPGVGHGGFFIRYDQINHTFLGFQQVKGKTRQKMLSPEPQSFAPPLKSPVKSK
jgi:hypothetical protein